MTQEQTLAYYELFEQLIDAMNDPAGFDRDKYIRLLSDICRLFRLSKGITELYSSPAHEKARDGEIMCDFDDGHGDVLVLERRIVSESMNVIIGKVYMSADAKPLDEEEYRRVDIVLRSMLSFVARNRLIKAVERLGFYDDSGFPNMRSFTRHLQLLQHDNKLEGKTAMCFNLLHFSVINRDIGRENGDIVITNYTDMIRELIGEDGILCRMGGDNFVLVCGSEDTEKIVNILRGVPVPYDKYKVKRVMVSASAGIFSIPYGFELVRPGQVIDSIFTAARVSRINSKDKIVYYDESLLQMKDRDMWVRRLFPGALDNDEFKAFYQPKVDVETGKIVGAEALCRWIQQGKIVPPMEFIPILEQNTDICILDFHMLDIVCRDIRRWLDEGRNAVRVSVNLSRKHLVDVDLIKHILEIIDRNRVPHEYIEVELTETTTDVEFRDLRRVVIGLQEAGVHVSVDDFGMGYSSLNLIRELPWDVLKIDKCFVPTDEETDDGITSKMFRHVVNMAQDIGLKCIAEGVETEKQLGLLKINKCDIAQGYYFDKPLPVNEFEERLDKGFYDISWVKKN